jgi:hypothetical protein
MGSTTIATSCGDSMIHLGFEVGTGAEVAIPLKHTVVTGQTQQAGKTTTLEAMISRSGVRALAFITKRGEGAFDSGSWRLDPYFREQADWQFVASILEASRGEKLKFERAWIIRASRGAHTLAQVQRNVRHQLETAKGMSADVYLTLDAYLDAVIPQIQMVKWATSIKLQRGVNVMDLSDLNIEMQHLVIRSSIDWVLNHEKNTVVVIPEAWKFIPQGRGTPVKLAAESYIRQGAGLSNFLWLDSQDIAGIDKLILKSCSLWLLGVQRESNEIKRTLDQIPGGIKKPSKDDIATLELGQFYACHGNHTTKTYVQPVWMNKDQARAVSLNQKAASWYANLKRKDDDVKPEEASRLKQENESLRQRITDLTREIEHLKNSVTFHANNPGVVFAPTKPENGNIVATTRDDEDFYQWVKERLKKEESQILSVLATKPELEVRVERKTILANGDTLRGRIGLMIANGFFKDPHTNSEVIEELAKRGHSTAPPNVSRELNELVSMGFFIKENKWYKLVPEMKVNVVET